MSSRIRTLQVSVAATAALATAFGIGWVMSPTTVEWKRTPVPGQPDISLAAGLTTVDSCDALLDSFIERGLEQVGPWGWDGGMELYARGGDAEFSGDVVGEAPTASSSKALSQTATSSDNGTNVQEMGVDEPDVVKVAGTLIARIEGRSLKIHDLSGDEPREVGELDLSDIAGKRISHLSDGTPPIQLLMSGSRLVVLIGHEWMPTTTVGVVDLADPSSPELISSTTYEGELDQARLHGDTVRVVIEKRQPDLDFHHPGNWLTEKLSSVRNRGVVRNSTIEDWLPTVDGEPAVPCEDVIIPDDTELGSSVVIGFDPAEVTEDGLTDPDLDRGTVGIATPADTAYFAQDRFYLATLPWNMWVFDCWDCGRVAPTGKNGVTTLHAFALDGLDTTYVASGEVEGSIRDRWSMDSIDGVLRVAVGPTQETGNFNSVVTLREEDGELVEAGRVDKLGVGEEIKSVRWFDDLAIVVTFRQTDPLYAIDLTNDDAPVLLGELKIPGFSEYLHPLGSDRLIGVGSDASMEGVVSGAQASLFNVADLTNPRQLDVVRYAKDTQALAGVDPRQFTWLPDRRTALTVITDGWSARTGWVSVLKVDNSKLENRLIEVDYGSDVSLIRTVPLSDGRVALVTADKVSFLDL